MTTVTSGIGGGQGRQDDKLRTIEIVVNSQHFNSPSKELTGLKIKQLAGIPTDYELFVVHGNTTVPVGNDEVVHIHTGSEFRAIPAGTFGKSVNATAATR